MGYALFANRKLVVDGQLNNVQLQQTQRSNEQYKMATQTLSLQQQLTSMNASQSTQLAALYEDLAAAPDDATRAQIDSQIKAKELEYEKEIDNINREIYKVSVKENAIEMVVKRLDTQVTALQKQLEATEDAEGECINRATPKFRGVS